MYWHEIPYQVKAEDAQGVFKVTLPSRFMQAINSAAIARGKYDTDAYAAGWHWGPKENAEGSAASLAKIIAQRLETSFSQEDLRQLILKHSKKPEQQTKTSNF